MGFPERFGSTPKNPEQGQATPVFPQNLETQADNRTTKLELQKIESDQKRCELKNFKDNHSDCFDEEDVDENDESNTKVAAKESKSKKNNSFSEVKATVQTDIEQYHSEFLKNFSLQFSTLFEHYKTVLAISDLTKPITITKDRFAKLPAAVQKVHTVNETVNPKELLAQVIFYAIISQKTSEINQKIQILHDPKEAAHKVLLHFELRISSEQADEKAVLPVGIEDLKRLNGRLNNIPNLHQRRDFLDDFVAQMSQAVGVSPQKYRMQLNAIMQEIKGLETLKLTVATLHKDGRLAETINNDGTLNTKFFTEYYQTASEQIAPKFKNFETVIEPKEEATSAIPIQPAIRTLTLEQAKENSVISDIAAKTPLIAKHFLTSHSAVRILATPEGNFVELQLDKNNPKHAVSLRISEETKKSDILIAGKAVMETSLEEHVLHKNLNSCSANHMILEELKIPKNCFISEPVDTKAIVENNDPYQLVKTVLGRDDFPETAVLSATPSLIGTLKKVLSIALGDDFKDANSSGEIERILEKNGWLDVNGKLVPEANVHFGKVYQEVKRDPSITSKAELEEVMGEEAA